LDVTAYTRFSIANDGIFSEIADWKTMTKPRQSSRPTSRCSGRASRPEIDAILELDFVLTVIPISTARR
jgi:hypothetical protein